MQNQITISLNEESKVSIQVQNPVSMETLTQLLCTAQLHFMNQLLTQVPQNNLSEFKERLYDSYNMAASTTLQMFAPELELRPDLTVEALKQAEDKILNNHWDSLSKKEQKKLQRQKSNLRAMPISINKED